MLISLEQTARRHAIVSCIRTVIIYAALIVPWFINKEGAFSIDWKFAILIALMLPAVMVLLVPLERIGGAIAGRLSLLPSTSRFHNVVSEISIAVCEPVESIRVFDCPAANVAMLPTPKGEIVVATSGALEELSRPELQAMVAAQFAGMRDKWCRLATKAEIMWWGLYWLFPLLFVGIMLGRPAGGIAAFISLFVVIFLPRWNEQSRDLCADVAAVRTTFDPSSLAGAMRKLAGQANRASQISFGAWFLPNNPFLVLPKRTQSTTTVSGGSSSRSWTSTDELRLELLLRADRAEALADGADPTKYTGREFTRRWKQLGRESIC